VSFADRSLTTRHPPQAPNEAPASRRTPYTSAQVLLVSEQGQQVLCHFGLADLRCSINVAVSALAWDIKAFRALAMSPRVCMWDESNVLMPGIDVILVVSSLITAEWRGLSGGLGYPGLLLAVASAGDLGLVVLEMNTSVVVLSSGVDGLGLCVGCGFLAVLVVVMGAPLVWRLK